MRAFNFAFAVHQYFQEKGFFYVNTPIITGSDAEGAGEMFQVTFYQLMVLLQETKTEASTTKKISSGKQTNLTVSGQLEGETFAMAFRSNLYVWTNIPCREFKHFSSLG